MQSKYCRHCWPTRRRNHFILHLEYYIDSIFCFLLKPFKYFHKKFDRLHKIYLWPGFLEFCAFLKIAKFVSEPDKTKLFNRSLIFFQEAKQRNLDIKTVKFFGKYVHEFKLIYKNKKYYFEGIPLIIFKEKDFEMYKKHECKRFLLKNNLPTVKGQIFLNKSKAFKFGNSIGFPLVVKPSQGSLSHHVTCNINSEKQLWRAIKIAKKYSPAFMVERFIAGDLFRASVIGKKKVFVSKKEKANVVGDGRSTIEKLIDEKNSHAFRGRADQLNCTLHKIPINEVLRENLAKQGYNLKSILPKNKKIYLQDKFVLSCGCDIINCTDFIHEQNKRLFLRAAKILQSDLIGIDFICSDIGKSYKKQESGILEVNSLPYIDMHQFPSAGKPEPVAKVVWDMVLDKLS